MNKMYLILSYYSIFNIVLSSYLYDYLVGKMYLWWRHNTIGDHDSIWIFFANFRYQKCAHPGTGTTSQRVSQLKSLQTVTTLCFLPKINWGIFCAPKFIYLFGEITRYWHIDIIPDHVQYRIHQLGSFCIVSFCPVISSARLSENKIIWSEYLTKRTRSHRVHGSRF